MSILIVGSEKKFTLENFYKENLIKCGEQCDIYPIKDLISDKYFKSIFRKVLFKLFKKAIILANNRKLIKRVKDLKPSFIIIFKGMYVLPRTILKLKNECFISNYNADHPFIFSSKGSGNSNVTKSISLYDLHLTYHPKVKKLIENKYGITTEIVPFGYEFEMTPYGEKDKLEEINRVCFIGNPDAKRVEVLSHIANAGYSIDVYGHGWDTTSITKFYNVSIFEAVYLEKLYATLRRYRVQLNIFREHNIGSHNMRTFEIPAASGIQLAPYSTQHAEFFKPNEEIFLYDSYNNMIFQIELILRLSQSEAMKIREKAISRTISSNYSYASRAKKILEVFKSQNVD